MYVSYHLILPKRFLLFFSEKINMQKKPHEISKLQSYVHAIKTSMIGTPKKDYYSLSLLVITYKPPLLSSWRYTGHRNIIIYWTFSIKILYSCRLYVWFTWNQRILSFSVSYAKHACRFIVIFIYICDIIKTEINNY